MLYRQWSLRPADAGASDELSRALGVRPLLASILVGRGCLSPEEATALLDEPHTLPDPFAMKDMDKAVRRIHTAIQNEEAIAVFGDYDVDGITATALLYTYLLESGAQVFFKLPSRSDDDYGLSPALVDQVADHGITLIVTVDNGTTAFEAVKRARERGVSIVITDHHLPYDELPDVDALVNPCRADDESGLSVLSGAGVAFMLLAALEGCPAEELLPVFGDLVAIGTVADVMKLTGPNRTIVKAGLAALQDTQRPGLAALINACGWGEKGVTVENISYGIAPRLNAAGRMDDATSALQLLLCDDEDEAAALVEGLQQQNAARQKAEQEILELIDKRMEENPELSRSRVLVVDGEGWHQGVIGIVASRLADRTAKPSIVVSFENGEGKGSGRSAGGFSLHGAIASCEDILLRYGGHDLAAGFSLKREHMDEFRRRVNQWAAENDPVPTLPDIMADAEIDLSTLVLEDVADLERLAPCGSGNPAPKFLLKGAVVEAVYPVSEGKHCRLRLRQGGGTLYTVMFGTGPERLAYRVGDTIDAMVGLSVHDGKQGPQISARVLEIRPAGLTGTHVAQSALFESFFAGAGPVNGQRAELLPTRDDTADVYRRVRCEAGISYNDARPAFQHLGEDRTGRVLTSLAALEELDLISRNKATGRYQVVPTGEKKNLEDSALLQRLHGES